MTIMINTVSKPQLLEYSHEKNKLWTSIKLDMAAETEELNARVLNELTSLQMGKDATVAAFINMAEALRNQCEQVEKGIEEFELKMFAFKQEIRRRERKKDQPSRDRESVRKVERQKSDIYCYNCGYNRHMCEQVSRRR